MSIANIPTSILKRIIHLQEQREALLSKVASIEAEIANVAAGAVPKAAPARRGRPPRAGGAVAPAKVSKPAAKVAVKGAPTRARRGRRGATGVRVLAALKAAGARGIRVSDLATQLKMKPQNLHVWFNTTGKKGGLTERVAKGTYRLKA